jgi:hypothetical protein
MTADRDRLWQTLLSTLSQWTKQQVSGSDSLWISKVMPL